MQCGKNIMFSLTWKSKLNCGLSSLVNMNVYFVLLVIFFSPWSCNCVHYYFCSKCDFFNMKYVTGPGRGVHLASWSESEEWGIPPETIAAWKTNSRIGNTCNFIHRHRWVITFLDTLIQKNMCKYNMMWQGCRRIFG